METDESKEILDFYRGYFLLPRTKLQDLIQDITNSMVSGLENHNRMSIANSIIQHPLKMLDSCINQLPSGNEQGIYYAIDMGGTNLRCVRVHLKGDGKWESRQKKIRLSDMKIWKFKIQDNSNSCFDECVNVNNNLNEKLEVNIMNKLVSSYDMFNAIAKFFNEFLIECGDINNPNNENGHSINKKFELAFTFSFPTSQFELGKANLISWTKGIETGRGTLNPVEGNDVGELLNSAFKRNGIPAHCKCIVNDTTGTLISAMYDLNLYTNDYETNEENTSSNLSKEIKKRPLIGIVIGTGVNACYVEPKSKQYDYKGLIINTECGDFYSLNLPITDCDLVLDWHSDNRGYQRFEKMISGTYLGEVCRLLLINILRHKTPHIFYKKNSITTEQISKIIDKFDGSEDIYSLERYLKDMFSTEFDLNSAYLLLNISNMVLKRAASLVSVLMAALIGKVDKVKEKITIAIDGSVWTKNPKFQNYVVESLCDILGDHILENVQFYESEDGSGKGAAILASVIS